VVNDDDADDAAVMLCYLYKEKKGGGSRWVVKSVRRLSFPTDRPTDRQTGQKLY